MDAGLLPVKRLDQAKIRLSNHFDPSQRGALSRAMLEDALHLCKSVDFLRWWVVSDDDEVLETAAAHGLEGLKDSGRGLNAAVKQGISTAQTAGAASVSIVPSDVPLATREDLEDLLDTGATSDVVVVPSRSDGGTNGLYLAPPDALEPRFGIWSLRAHLDMAERLSLRCSVLNLPRLALDLDTVDDVDELLRQTELPSRTSELLMRLDAPRPPVNRL